MDSRGGAHGKVCKTLRKLATWNSDRHTKSIIKLLLQVLMNHWRERQGIPTAYQSRMTYQVIKDKRRKDENKAQVNINDCSSQTEVSKAIDREAAGDNLTERLEISLHVKESDDPANGETQSPSSSSVPPSPLQVLQGKLSGAEADLTDTAVHQTEAAIDIKLKPKHEFEEPEIIDDRQRIQEPIENDFFDFLRLQSHFEDWDEEDTKDWNKQSQTVLSLLEMAGLTEIATERGNNTELRTLTSQDIKRLISALESNAFGMFDRSKKKPICFGRAIYPVASFFNHSCECNSTAVQADGTLDELDGHDVIDYLEFEKNDN
ncbi:hypothetical protein BX616_007830, partial [Lobosporangium transversale]